MGNQPSSTVLASDHPIATRLGSTNAIPFPTAAASTKHAEGSSPQPIQHVPEDYLSRTLDQVIPDPFKDPLCMLLSSDTALDAILTFHRHNISSIPIRLGDGQFALLDQADLMFHFGQARLDQGEAAWDATRLPGLLRTPCGSLANRSQMNPTVAVPLTATVAETLHKVSVERAHRLLVLDANKELYQIVSQTQMLRYLLPALDSLLPAGIATRSLASLNWTGGPPPIRFVKGDTPVTTAIELCLQHRLHRLPVTFPADASSCSASNKPKLGVFGAWDVTRTLVVPGGNTSSQLSPNQRKSLSSLTLDPARGLSPPFPPWSPGPASAPSARVGEVCERACCVDISDPLIKVVGLLATRSREVILADDMGHPVHIITQGDCLRYLYSAIQAQGEEMSRRSRKASVDYD